MRQRLPDLIVFVIAAAAFLFGALDGLDNALMDLRFRFDKHRATDRVVIVDINESSIQEFGVWPWPRRYHARVIDRLMAAGADEIALDIDFSSRSTPEDDAALATALAKAGSRVILPVFRQLERQPDGEIRTLRSVPLEVFRQSARLASFNVRPEHDGRIRRIEYRGDENGVPSFATMAAGQQESDANRYYIDFGIDVRSLTRISYADVMSGRFDPNLVAGKLVLVGATAVQLGDMITVPVYRSLPGIVVQALAYQSLEDGLAFHGIDPAYTISGTLLLALFAGSLLRRYPWRIALAGTAFAVLVLLGATFLVQSAAAVFIAPAAWVLTLILSFAFAMLAKINQQDILLLVQGLAMRRRSAMMKLIVENSFDAILTVTKDGEVRTINPAAEALFGYSADELTGQNVAMLLDGAEDLPASPPDRQDFVKELLSRTGTRQIAASDRQGAGKHLELSIGRMMLAQESLIILIARDVTKRVEAERAILQAKEAAELSSRTKTDFLHNMSHELRTPLNAIIGFSEVMRTETFGPLAAQYAEYAKDIHESGRHLLSLINDILDVAKIESGRFEIAEETMHISDILDSAGRLVRDRALRGGVALSVAARENLPAIRADARVVKQVLLNLLDNAVKFTPAGGRVSATAALDDAGRLRVTVADSGIGVPADQVERVMEPFGQVEGSLSRKHGGTGLGLPLAKRFMEMHGGTLTLESELGVGTTVTIEFPEERVMRALPQPAALAS